VAAGAIEPQQMIAQQGQFLLAQDSNDTPGRTGELIVVHVQNSSQKALKEASNP
jgi:hypothetical protein